MEFRSKINKSRRTSAFQTTDAYAVRYLGSTTVVATYRV